jgi:hypothetical protein
MTDTSKAARIARRQARRDLVRMGRRTARAMLLAGDFDAMPTHERAIRRTEGMRDR